MSAWKKQAIPLIFVEVCMDAILKSNGHIPAIARISKRVDRWVGECWAPLRAKAGRIPYDRAQKITVKAAASIQRQLAKFWSDGIQTSSEIPNAMLVVTEDTYAVLDKVKHKARRRSWGFLIRALVDLSLVADPEIDDHLGQERGVKLGEMVMKEAGY